MLKIYTGILYLKLPCCSFSFEYFAVKQILKELQVSLSIRCLIFKVLSLILFSFANRFSLSAFL
jgi:hypothetical protein